MSRVRLNHAVGLGDLILLLDQFGPDVGAQMAAFAGFSAPERAGTDPMRQASINEPDVVIDPGPAPSMSATTALDVPTFWDLTFWVVVRREPIQWQIMPDGAPNTSEDDAQAVMPPVSQDVVPPPDNCFFPRQRLDSDLRHFVGRGEPSRRLDSRVLVERLARGDIVRHLPRVPFTAWPRDVVVVVDGSDHLRPYVAEFWKCAKALQSLLGQARLRIGYNLITKENQLFAWRPRGLLRMEPFQVHPETLVLALSDLGSLFMGERARNRWNAWGTRWADEGARLVALQPALPLIPAPDTPWATLLTGPDDRIFPWLTPPEASVKTLKTIQQQALVTLLGLVSLTVQCSFSMLRQFAALLPAETHGLGLESLVLQHEHVSVGRTLVRVHSEALVVYRRYWRSRRNDKLTQELLVRAWALISARHLTMNPVLAGEEAALFPMQCGWRDKPDLAFFKQLEQMMREQNNEDVARYINRFEERYYQNSALWTSDDVVLRLLAHKRRLLPRLRHPAYPAGAEAFVGVMDDLLTEPKRRYGLFYRHATLQLERLDDPATLPNGFHASMKIAEIETGLPHVLAGAEASLLARQPLSQDAVIPVTSHRSDQLILRTEREIVTLKSLPIPEEAESMAFAEGGLTLTLNETYDRRTLRWLAPGSQTLPDGSVYHRIKGAWVDARLYEALDGENFPPPQWATRLGLDGYGVWAEFEVKGVTQRMRWIEAGIFNMGSDVAEGSDHYEQPKHPVWLTRPFWLADTACSQALWVALENENPSDYSGLDRPVENVSWRATVAFIQKLNQTLGTELFRLPREAEWEYACRAGTETAFSSGDQLTKVQANFAGDQTVPVFSFLPNAWGLYQMHGNVWEWCDDGLRAYTAAVAVDPCGPEGTLRVFRGGSDWNGARPCRSAYRGHLLPGFAWRNQGFRVASGP